MRIVSYEEMKREPVGTVFYRLGKAFGLFDGPYRVDHVDPNHTDLYYFTIGPQYIEEGFYARENPEIDYTQFVISNMGEREGLFEQDAKYLVLDAVDVQMLVHNLTAPGGEPNESRVRIPDNLELP